MDCGRGERGAEFTKDVAVGQQLHIYINITRLLRNACDTPPAWICACVIGKYVVTCVRECLCVCVCMHGMSVNICLLALQ